jgi:hypothetical protein
MPKTTEPTDILSIGLKPVRGKGASVHFYEFDDSAPVTATGRANLHAALDLLIQKDLDLGAAERKAGA